MPSTPTATPPSTNSPNASSADACFLSFDLSPKRLRGLIVDCRLDVLFADEITFDSDVPAYGTKNGVHLRGNSCPAPTHMYIAAFDFLLEKISASFDMQRIKAISGSAPQHSSVWWSKAAPALLNRLNPFRRLSDQLPADRLFTFPDPPTPQDLSSSAHAPPFSWFAGGPAALADRSGGRGLTRQLAVQVMKMVQMGQRNSVMATEKVAMGGGLLSALLTGNLTTMTESDAATTGLWNVKERRWDPKLLDIVLKSHLMGRVNTDTSIFECKLGQPDLEGKPLGSIHSYFVRRHNFRPSTLVVPFLSHHVATFLSHPLEPNDVLLSLGKADSDSLVLSVPSYVPDPGWQMLPHPATGGDRKGAEESGYVAVLDYKDAALARSFIMGTYCSGSWQVFDTLVALATEGGSIGLDDKQFSFFWPHGEIGVWQGISRFETGQRIEEFQDRRSNPRLILESQLLTMRMHLARLHTAAKRSPNRSPSSPPHFDPHDRSVLPKRLIVFGGATENQVLIELTASILGCPVFQPTALAASSYGPSFKGRDRAITMSGLGAAYKAAFDYEQSKSSVTTTYREFLEDAYRQRTQRRQRSSTLDGARPILTNSMATFEAPEVADSRTAGHGAARRMSFSTVKLSNGHLPGSPSTTSSTPGVLVVPIHTSADDAERGLIQVAEPDLDLFERYGGQVEEFARLDYLFSRGII